MSGEGYTLDWRGAEIVGLAQESARAALTATLQQAVTIAQDNAPVRTGRYRRSIRIVPVARTANGFTGGITTTVSYGLWIEIGTKLMPPRWILTNAMRAVAPQFATRVAQNMQHHAPAGPSRGGNKGWQNY